MGHGPGMTIDGSSAWSDRSLEVEDPSSNDVIGVAPYADQAHVDAAVAAAERAFPAWRADADGRVDALQAAAKAVDAAADELGRLTTIEQGKPLAGAVLEARALSGLLADAADLRLVAEVVRDDDGGYARVWREPLGVVAAVTPWNSALYVAGMKLGPALAAGNTVVLKPSPETPLATLRLGEVLQDVLPRGVLNVVTGGDDVGPRLTAHPDVRAVSFTGSIGTGKKVAAAAADDLKRIVLELGGNDPAVVLDDADVEDVIAALFANAFGNAGQVCSGVKRVYVHERLYGEVVDGLAARAAATKVGPGLDPDTEMGPLTTAAQLREVARLVDAAVADGATVVAGGQRLDRPGYFYAPTVVTGAGDDTALVAEEQFGPALPVLSFSSEDEVLDRVNRGMYGLGASVWTNDFERGVAFADRFDSGMRWVNSHKGADPSLPFGGSRWSGIGVERGRWGMDCFTQLVVTSGTRPKPARTRQGGT